MILKVLAQKSFITILTISGFLFIAASLSMSHTANALSGGDFNAARIADDTVFFNKYSMTQQEIQTFMNVKVPSCDTNGSAIYSGSTTRAQYSATRGYYPPFTCLKDYTENTPNRNSESALCNTYYGGFKNSSQIIYDVAQACGVSPKVLLVLLQKEQGLLTDAWPWTIQYRSATGFGCPDTAPCDSEYYGFFNQVYNAARIYKKYERDASNYNYRKDRNNYVQYNPNINCGGSNIYIVNQATAGLYNYTPYQPNAAALNNLYGTGDGCSAYGNRNFWRMFSEYFGTTTAFYATNASQVRTFTDASMTQETSHNQMLAGNKVFIQIKFRNNGDAIWTNYGLGAVRLSTSAGNPFCDTGWISCSRVVDMKESSVGPGGYATFEFWYKAPSTPGAYATQFALVSEMITNIIGDAPMLYTYVNPPLYANNNSQVRVFTDASMGQQINANTLSPNDKVFIQMKFRNNGNVVWKNYGSGAVRLATANNSYFCDLSWINCARPANMKEAEVGLGGYATFEFWYKAPSTPGDYATRFAILAETVSGMDGEEPIIYTRVTPRIYATNASQVRTFTDASMTQETSHNQMLAGNKVFIQIKFRNNGNVAWMRSGVGPVRLAVAASTPSLFCDTSWISCFRPTAQIEDMVNPGQNATFEFWYKAPSTPGAYATQFALVSESVATMSGERPILYTYVN